MKLWNIFAVAALAAGNIAPAQAQGKVRIGNIYTNSGSMPSGNYSSHNGVIITAPNNLPADAYTVNPRTGQHVPVRPQTAVPAPVIPQVPGWQAITAQPELKKTVLIGEAFSLKSGNGKNEVICLASVLDTSITRDIKSLCADKNNIPGNLNADLVEWTPIKSPYMHRIPLAANREAFCRSSINKADALQNQTSIISAGASAPACIILTYAK